MNQRARSDHPEYLIQRLCRGLAVATAAAMLAGCASIHHFAVSPRTACSGDTVVADWSAAGQVQLSSTPSLQGTGKQPDHGQKPFLVHQSTRFVLTAKRLFGSKTAEADVSVAPRERSYGTVASCDAESRRISADLTLEHQLSGSFSVATVGNPLDRQLRVAKAGKTQTLPPHGRSNAFRGEATRGVWQLSSPLAPGETCESAMRSIRQRLQMQLQLICGR